MEKRRWFCRLKSKLHRWIASQRRWKWLINQHRWFQTQRRLFSQPTAESSPETKRAGRRPAAPLTAHTHTHTDTHIYTQTLTHRRLWNKDSGLVLEPWTPHFEDFDAANYTTMEAWGEWPRLPMTVSVPARSPEGEEHRRRRRGTMPRTRTQTARF